MWALPTKKPENAVASLNWTLFAKFYAISLVSYVAMRVPKHRPPMHPGEILLKDFLEPFAISQTELALFNSRSLSANQ